MDYEDVKLAKILVGYDGREHSRAALDLARLLARSGGGRVTAACIYGLVPLNSVMGPGAPASPLREDAERVERELEASYGRDVAVRLLMAQSPARGLEIIADEEHVDLIVLGSTWRGRLSSAVPGTTADQLLRRTGIPVAVAPRDYVAPDRLERIGAAFCTDPPAPRALDVAVAIAKRAGATVEVIGAFEGAYVERVHSDRLGAPEVTVNLHESAQVDLEDAVRERAGSVPIDTKLVDGAPEAVLVEEAGQLDLLVLDSRARSPLGRIVLGSVSHSTLLHSPSPVLLVPRDHISNASERNSHGNRRVDHI